MYYILFFSFIVFAYLGFGFFRNLVLPKVNVQTRIKLLEGVDVDFLGAIVPVIVSFFMIVYLLRVQKFSWRKYLHHFLLAAAISIMFSRGVSGAIIVYYQLIGLFIAIVSFLLSFYKGSFRRLFYREGFRKFNFTLRNHVNSVLISYSFGSLASLMTDILWLPFASFSMYIGGKGLEDGIFLVGLYSALSVLLFASLMRFFVSEG